MCALVVALSLAVLAPLDADAQISSLPNPTAAIRGRVFAGDTGKPLRRARVAVNAPELPGPPRTASTDLDGRYEIKELPAGRYTVSVGRSGYLSLSYGQRRPLEQGKLLDVLDRQVVNNVDFTLPRMSAITGRIADETGEPLAGVRVFVMQSKFFEGARRLTPAGTNATTDDAGQYRIQNLVPGTYYLMAMLRDAWTVTEDGVDRVFAYIPTYFPGTNNVGDARRVTVGVGQQLIDTDFSLIPGRAASMSGRAYDSHGRPLAGETVYLTQEFRSADGRTEVKGGGDASVAPDGTFAIKNLPPGDYKLRMHVDNGGAQENMATLVSIDGENITNLLLTTSVGWSMSGQIVTDTGAAPTIPQNRLRIIARLLSGDSDPRTGGNQGVAQIKNDWTFTLERVYGPARLRITLPDGWSVKSILHDGRDIGDAPMEFKSGEQLTGVQVVVVNRTTRIIGQLADERGAPLADGTVIVFASDATKWSEDSRFVRAVRPDQKGQYQLRGLPAGEYLAVAVDYVPDGLWNDPEYLESLRRYAQTLTIAEGSSQSLSLKLANP